MLKNLPVRAKGKILPLTSDRFYMVRFYETKPTDDVG
jgi:hypothetical protein